MEPGFIPGTAVVPCTKVEVSVSCRNLADGDVFSKSDPMCVLKTTDRRTGKMYEVGRTEVIQNNLNPDFVKKFLLDYFFEERQMLKFEIYDVDSSSSQLTDHDFLGSIECSLGELVSAPNSCYERNLQLRRGKIIVRTEEVSTCKDDVVIQLKGMHLDKKDFFGKSDPFLMFYRVNEDFSCTLVHKTEVVKNTLNPTWQSFSMSVRQLCNGDYDRSVKVECYDWDSDGGHDFIGEFSTNLRELIQSSSCSRSFQLINPKKKAKKKNYKDSGEVQVMSCRIQPQYSFLDFIKGGLQMNFTVAIDFTASNGNPTQSTSLHFMNPYQPNQYSAAIQAVGEIIQDYDSDKMFPVLGFGARIDSSGVASHEFAVNFNPSNPYCCGVEGILQAYHTALPRLQLYGPTNFSPVINHVKRFAFTCQDGSHYFVLLILTDGIITDMQQTIDAIVEASFLPMSVIVVGIGNAEFDAMDELDADDHTLRSQTTGKYAERDIVQFVPFRDVISGQFGADINMSKVALAKEVLAEIPDQVVLYMKKRNIQPKSASAVPVAAAASLPPQ